MRLLEAPSKSTETQGLQHGTQSDTRSTGSVLSSSKPDIFITVCDADKRSVERKNKVDKGRCPKCNNFVGLSFLNKPVPCVVCIREKDREIAVEGAVEVPADSFDSSIGSRPSKLPGLSPTLSRKFERDDLGVLICNQYDEWRNPFSGPLKLDETQELPPTSPAKLPSLIEQARRLSQISNIATKSKPESPKGSPHLRVNTEKEPAKYHLRPTNTFQDLIRAHIHEECGNESNLKANTWIGMYVGTVDRHEKAEKDAQRNAEKLERQQGFARFFKAPASFVPHTNRAKANDQKAQYAFFKLLSMRNHSRIQGLTQIPQELFVVLKEGFDLMDEEKVGEIPGKTIQRGGEALFAKAFPSSRFKSLDPTEEVTFDFFEVAKIAFPHIAPMDVYKQLKEHTNGQSIRRTTISRVPLVDRIQSRYNPTKSTSHSSLRYSLKCINPVSGEDQQFMQFKPMSEILNVFDVEKEKEIHKVKDLERRRAEDDLLIKKEAALNESTAGAASPKARKAAYLQPKIVAKEQNKQKKKSPAQAFQPFSIFLPSLRKDTESPTLATSRGKPNGKPNGKLQLMGQSDEAGDVTPNPRERLVKEFSDTHQQEERKIAQVGKNEKNDEDAKDSMLVKKVNTIFKAMCLPTVSHDRDPDPNQWLAPEVESGEDSARADVDNIEDLREEEAAQIALEKVQKENRRKIRALVTLLKELSRYKGQSSMNSEDFLQIKDAYSIMDLEQNYSVPVTMITTLGMYYFGKSFKKKELDLRQHASKLENTALSFSDLLLALYGHGRNSETQILAQLQFLHLGDQIPDTIRREAAMQSLSSQFPVNVLKEIIQIFELYDKDGKGYLTLEEFKMYFKSPHSDEDKLEAIFHEQDLHKDGKLDLEEFAEMMSFSYPPYC